MTQDAGSRRFASVDRCIRPRPIVPRQERASNFSQVLNTLFIHKKRSTTEPQSASTESAKLKNALIT